MKETKMLKTFNNSGSQHNPSKFVVSYFVLVEEIKLKKTLAAKWEEMIFNLIFGMDWIVNQIKLELINGLVSKNKTKHRPPQKNKNKENLNSLERPSRQTVPGVSQQ